MNAHLTRATALGINATLAGWGLLTVAQQLGRGRRLTTTLDPTGITIPDWRFFAPTPATHEYRLLVRTQGPDEQLTTWRDLMITQDRRWQHMLWAPHRRMEKSLFDTTAALMATSRSHEGETSWSFVRSSPAYLALLNHVTHRVEHPDRATHVQFLVAQAATHEPELLPTPVLTSDLHALRPRTAGQARR